MSLVGRVFTNRYDIEREIAQGGMAEVYLARDRLLDRPVALKALFPEYAREPSFVERFRREAQAAANLNHPNIVSIYDWGQESGTYFIVMEHVEGRSLRDLIRSEGPLEAAQASEITAEIAGALAFAHRSGVVHRDVKPGNVLLTRSGTVKVADFGIARAGTSDGLTQTGSVMGTATYFSPEQAQGLPVDGRGDVYSLGVVLYEMVTGVVPFTGDSPVAVAYKHVREAPVPPSRRSPEVPEDLERIILTAMAKEPDHRYQTADDMRADLLRFRRGRPLAAAPVTALVAEVPTAAAAAAYAANATMQQPRVPGPPGGPPGPAPRSRAGRNRALATALTLLVLVLIVALIYAVGNFAGDTDPELVLVPDVTTTNVDAARAALESEGFEVDVKNVPNPDVELGIVFDQDPKGGEQAEEDSTVTISVSEGASDVEVPDVDGESRTDAAQMLLDAGFEIELVGEQSEEVDLDFVIRTDPDGGDTAPAGSTVQLVVSQGPPPIPVPDVTNELAEDASRIIQDAGFTVAIEEAPDDEVEAGRVVSTDPPGGSELTPGLKVTITVSLGTDKVSIPPLIGAPETEARTQLEALGLTVRRVEQLSTAGNDGVVLGVDPSAGTLVDPGSSVVLTVGVTSTPPTTTTPAT